MSYFRYTLLLSAALLCTSLCACAESTSADQMFPDTTKGFFSIRNFKEFGDQWKQTRLGQLMNDPLMEDFKKEIQKQITQRMEKTFGLTFDGISSLPTGEVAFGMIDVPNQTPGYVLTMDVTGKRVETEEYLKRLTEKLTSAGVKKHTEEYKGHQMAVLTFPPPATPIVLGNTKEKTALEPIERRAYYMFRQDILIASDQLHLLRLIADRIADQTGKSLANVEAYQVVMKRCIDDMPSGTLPSICWYIEPLDYGESIRVLTRMSVAQNRRNRSSIFSILKQQGFDAIQGIGGMVSVKTESQESVYRTFIYTKKPYRLAMQMLNFPDNTHFAPPVWMPSDLARCTMFYVDPLAIFDNFGVLFDALVMSGEEGAWTDILAGLEEDPHGPMINFREELIANLSNRVLGMSRYEKPITIKSESIVLAMELKADRESVMLAGLEKLFGTDPEMQGTEHNSYKIWHRIPVEETWTPIDFDIPPLVPVDTVPKKMATPSVEQDAPPVFPDGGVVVAKGCLFVSTNIDYLKMILDRLDSPDESVKTTIGNELEYKEVDRIFAGMDLTDKPHFFQFFARTQETLRPTYELIRKEQMAKSQTVLGKALNGLLSPDDEPGTRRQIFDGTTLPEFDKVQHYFGKVGIYGVSENNGYFIKGFSME